MRGLRHRSIALIGCLLMLSTACDADDPEADALHALIDDLPSGCSGLGPTRPVGQVTFTAKGRVYAASPDGRSVRCIAQSRAVQYMSWGGEADRLLLGGRSPRLLLTDFNASLGAQHTRASWSRPTGTSVISISPEGALLKLETTGGDVRDISFLARHDEALYHPAGTHIAVVGESARGTYGIYLANNLGEDPQLLAEGHDAKHIYDLNFSHDGSALYYAADHGTRYDVHSLELFSGADANSTEHPVAEGRLKTLYSERRPVHEIVVSELSRRPLVAYQKGCGPNSTAAHMGRETFTLGGALAEVSTRPVGWLPDDRLVVLAYDEGCAGSGDLYLWSPEGADLLVEGVRRATVRANLPPPPDPPRVATEVVA